MRIAPNARTGLNANFPRESLPRQRDRVVEAVRYKGGSRTAPTGSARMRIVRMRVVRVRTAPKHIACGWTASQANFPYCIVPHLSIKRP